MIGPAGFMKAPNTGESREVNKLVFTRQNPLTEAEERVLDIVRQEAPYGLLYALMDRDERKIANQLAKRGFLRKGHADLNQKPVAFFPAD